MITGTIDVNSQTWTEVSGGATRLQFSSKSSRGVVVRFSENTAPDDSISDGHRFGSWPNGFDFSESDYPEGQNVWVKSIADTDTLLVTRNANFHFLFIPSGRDALITSDSNTFKVLGDG